MLMRISELRNYIRNALAPSTSDREQLKFIGKRSDIADSISNTQDIPETNFTIEPDSEEFNVFIYDPYVTQDFPAPSSGNRKLGRS